jgi:peptidoglycan/LPS O-acetylase OafA/YrhL
MTDPHEYGRLSGPALPLVRWTGDPAPPNSFDLLRLFLAALVLHAHSYVVLMPGGRRVTMEEPLARLTHGQLSAGEVAVDAFFALSGFLILHSWLSAPRLTRFLWKRVLRLYPAFLVAALFAVFIAGPLGAADPRRFLAGLHWPWVCFCLVTLQEPPGPGTFLRTGAPGVLNTSLWTIAYEFWCYLGIALLGSTGLVRRRSVLPTLFVSAWLVSQCSLRLPLRPFYFYGLLPLPLAGPWPRLASFFWAGACFYDWRERIPAERRWLLVALALLLGTACTGWGLNALLPLLLPYVLFWIGFCPWPRLHRFGRWGDFSYGLYLYGWPIQQLLAGYWGQWLTPGSLFFAASLLTLPLAIGSWFLVERPALRLKARVREPVSARARSSRTNPSDRQLYQPVSRGERGAGEYRG